VLQPGPPGADLLLGSQYDAGVGDVSGNSGKQSCLALQVF
jgi:hypothetical protein